MRLTIKHTKTDPACRHYRTPRSTWARRRYDWAHGRSCWICVPPIAVLLDPRRMKR